MFCAIDIPVRTPEMNRHLSLPDVAMRKPLQGMLIGARVQSDVEKHAAIEGSSCPRVVLAQVQSHAEVKDFPTKSTCGPARRRQETQVP